MDLKINDKSFLICGASGGFGNAIAHALLDEGARVITIARSEDNLEKLAMQYPGKVKTVTGDLRDDEIIDRVYEKLGDERLDGILLNAGGPPAKSFLETDINDWDDAYQLVLRWKINFIKAFLPRLIYQHFGRILLIESVSVKQPVENLVLSNALRMAVVGTIKTLSQEVAGKGVTMNILAPGYHDTNALKRVIRKRAEVRGITYDEAKKSFAAEVDVKRIGTAEEFASLALWLLSPLSGYITGQTISVDGGRVKGAFG